jgi:SAM-dependent methyltransferase
MAERTGIDQKARMFFEDLWKHGDPWDLESSEFEQRRYARLFAALAGRRYGRVLEIGCGAGTFTRLLAPLADQLIALDISSTAIARAREVDTSPGHVDFRVANIMEYNPRAEGPWDLIVMSETIYFLGWLYSFFDVTWVAAELFAATSREGRLLLANTIRGYEDALLLPWIIHTYRDLFRNVGYQLESEEMFRDTKHGIPLEVLISLFVKKTEATKGYGF